MISLLYEEQMFFGFPKINLKRKDFIELLCYHKKMLENIFAFNRQYFDLIWLFNEVN